MRAQTEVSICAQLWGMVKSITSFRFLLLALGPFAGPFHGPPVTVLDQPFRRRWATPRGQAACIAAVHLIRAAPPGLKGLLTAVILASFHRILRGPLQIASK